MAIACLRLFTRPPRPPGPLFNVPRLRRRIALSTRRLAAGPYRRRPPRAREWLRERPPDRPPARRRLPPVTRPLELRLMRFLIPLLHGLRMLSKNIPAAPTQIAGQKRADRS
jgi:hypothetical protein